MPFNPSGLLVRLHNWVSDRDAGTKILAERMDQEFDNAFTGINAILGGEQAFLGPIEVPYGTAAEPAVQIGGEMGIYRKTATALGVSVGGVEVAVVSPAGTSAPEARTAMTREKGDARYLRSGVEVNMGGYAFINVGRIEFSQTDYISWTTTQGATFHENGVEVARIGTHSYVPESFLIDGNKPFHAGRTSSQLGGLVWARSAAPSTLTVNATISGGNLRPSDNTGHTDASSLSGTWRCLGYCQPGNATLFVRIA